MFSYINRRNFRIKLIIHRKCSIINTQEIKGMICFMRRFVTLILSFFVFFSAMFSHASAEISPSMSVDSKAFVDVSFIKLGSFSSSKGAGKNTPLCYYNEKTTSFCLGVVKFKLKNHQNLMPSVKFNIRLNSPNALQILWGKTKAMFRWRTFFEILIGGLFGGATDLRKNILGASCGAALGFFTADSGYSNLNTFKVNINNIPVEYRLVPVSPQEVDTLAMDLVNPGEKKKSLKDLENFYENIDKANGKTVAEKLAENLIKKPAEVMNHTSVDPGDPFNAVQAGNVLKYDGYRSPKNLNDYISQAEAKAMNAQIYKSKGLICDKYSNAKGIDSSNFNDGNVAVLSKDNPEQCFAVIVNNVDKQEALKLKLLMERSLAREPSESDSKLLFGTQIAYDTYDWLEIDGDTIIDLGVEPCLPARVVKFFLPNGIAQYGATAVDYIWRFVLKAGIKSLSLAKNQYNKIINTKLDFLNTASRTDPWYTHCFVTAQNGAKTIVYYIWAPIRSLGEWVSGKISGYFNFELPPDSVDDENSSGMFSPNNNKSNQNDSITSTEQQSQQNQQQGVNANATPQQQSLQQNPYNAGSNQCLNANTTNGSTQTQQNQQQGVNANATPQQQQPQSRAVNMADQSAQVDFGINQGVQTDPQTVDTNDLDNQRPSYIW